MARFYLHIKEGTHLIRDEEGCNVADFDQARAIAIRSARELCADCIRAGMDITIDAFVIADEQGEQLAFVPLVEALPDRLRSSWRVR
jgi:hypothetical protein